MDIKDSNNFDTLSDIDLIEALFKYYKPLDDSDTVRIIGQLVKSELANRLNKAEKIKKINRELNAELDECENLFTFMAELVGINISENATTEELENFATELTYQFKNLVIYREFVKAILRHLTIDEDLGIIAISILKDANSDTEIADYNYINAFSKQINKSIEEQTVQNFNSDTDEVC